MQRAEVAAAALGIGVAADDKILALLTFDFDPIVRTAAEVAALGFFRDDPLKSML